MHYGALTSCVFVPMVMALSGPSNALATDHCRDNPPAVAAIGGLRLECRYVLAGRPTSVLVS